MKRKINNKELFINFLQSGTLDRYSVGQSQYPKDKLIYEDVTVLGDTLYAYDSFYHLYSYEDTIKSMGVNVWQKEFISFLEEDLLIKSKKVKNILNFLSSFESVI